MNIVKTARVKAAVPTAVKSAGVENMTRVIQLICTCHAKTLSFKHVCLGS